MTRSDMYLRIGIIAGAPNTSTNPVINSRINKGYIRSSKICRMLLMINLGKIKLFDGMDMMTSYFLAISSPKHSFS